MGAKCDSDEIIVDFWQNKRPQTRTWSQYEAIGGEAMVAVVEARWDCQKLQQLAQGFQKREIDRNDTEARLTEMLSNASSKCARRSTWVDDPEKSVFD